MWAGLTLVTPPAAEPVSIAEAKAHSRIFTDLDDSLLAGYISAARMKCENNCQRAFLTQTWNYALQHFPGRRYLGSQLLNNQTDYYKYNYIKIPLPPLVSINLMTYMDTNGNVYYMQQGYSNVVGNYLLDLDHEPGRINLPYAGIWPTTVLLPTSPIHILFTAGWPITTGTVDVDMFGNVTLTSNPLASPPQGTFFDPRMTGSWITIGGPANGSPPGPAPECYNVGSYVSPTQLTLAAPPAAPLSGATFVGNCLPMGLRQAILFMAAHLYETREPVITGRGEVAVEIPGTVDDMLSPYRIFESCDTDEGAN